MTLKSISQISGIHGSRAFPKISGDHCPLLERNALVYRNMQNPELEQFPKPDKDRERLVLFFSGLRAREAGSRVIESGIDQT
jgi:hypothetical protein